jgi:hypothetical protein
MRSGARARKFFKLTALTLTVNWALGLAFFFYDPQGTQQMLNSCYNWMTGKKFVPQAAGEPCVHYESIAWRLSDGIDDYYGHAVSHGIESPKYIRDVRAAYHAGKLLLVEPTDLYTVDTMHYSYAFATPETKQFIDTLAQRFQDNLRNTDLHGAKLTVTSLLRTQSSVARLVKNNRNATRRSAHLHGTAFDVSYATYQFSRPLEQAEKEHLREVLARTLYDLREEKRCWVKYEIYQTCFHVVTRDAFNS